MRGKLYAIFYKCKVKIYWRQKIYRINVQSIVLYNECTKVLLLLTYCARSIYILLIVINYFQKPLYCLEGNAGSIKQGTVVLTYDHRVNLKLVRILSLHTPCRYSSLCTSLARKRAALANDIIIIF